MSPATSESSVLHRRGSTANGAQHSVTDGKGTELQTHTEGLEHPCLCHKSQNSSAAAPTLDVVAHTAQNRPLETSSSELWKTGRAEAAGRAGQVRDPRDRQAKAKPVCSKLSHKYWQIWVYCRNTRMTTFAVLRILPDPSFTNIVLNTAAIVTKCF